MKADLWVGSLALLMTAGTLVGCDDGVESEEEDFTSAQATLLEFEFDGELVTTETFNLRETIQDQLLYTIGHLNEKRSVGRLDTVQVEDIQTTRQDDGTTLVKYHAKLPVAWGSKTNLPKTYELKLPRRIDFEGLQKFSDAYKSSCVDFGAHDVSPGNLWYYYRPATSGCALVPADVVKLTATVDVSLENTRASTPSTTRSGRTIPEGRVDLRQIRRRRHGEHRTPASRPTTRSCRREASLRPGGSTTTPTLGLSNPGVANPDVDVPRHAAGRQAPAPSTRCSSTTSPAPRRAFYDRYEGPEHRRRPHRLQRPRRPRPERASAG
jgi:hypothetical protein